MVSSMGYYTVESIDSVLSVHLTLVGARAALRLRGEAEGAFVKHHSLASAFMSVATIAVFAAIGFILAWRG